MPKERELEEDPIKRGVLLRLYPTERQEKILDYWRCLTVDTWNLFLEIETAAYSGENVRPELRWRQIWENIITELYAADKKMWDSGRPATGKRKEILPGAKQMALYEKALAEWQAHEEAIEAWKNGGKKGPKPEGVIKKPFKPREPSAPDSALLDKIHGRNFPPPTIQQELGLYKGASDTALAQKLRRFRRQHNVVRVAPGLRDMVAKKIKEAEAAIEEHKKNPQDYPRHEGPRLFVWGAGKGRELLALLARLKKVPQTAWLDELPSHASQRVCLEMLGALGKIKSQGAGFPRFKTKRRDGGSVYLANTSLNHIVITPQESYVKLPKGVGQVRCEPQDARLFRERSVVKHYAWKHQGGEGRHGIRAARTRFNERVKGGKILGGRIYRRGEKWWLSVQYDLPKPAATQHPRKKAGVKISAANLLTVVDDEGRNYQIKSVTVDERQKRRIRFLALKQSRQEAEQKKKADKQRKRREAADKKPANKKRPPSPKNYVDTLNKIKREQSIIGERRRRHAHAETTKIAREYEHIVMRTMETATLMKKKRRKSGQGGRKEGRRMLATRLVRKIMANAAMSSTATMLEYKVRDSGGEFTQVSAAFKDVQTCSACGTVNEQMRDGRRVFHCTHCGNAMQKDVNAAHNALQGIVCPECNVFNAPMRDGIPVKTCAECGAELSGKK